ncbi:hypothetical protein VHUM_01913 [Vanrija humicola]|uniref:chitin deacetylase n=1 Tax=Vanrija humicola TaxID=5417 RepID=A0A7D8ZB21_VANHU|nr:hypothetical protein VHUM_01913 [Vanrija humicola]
MIASLLLAALPMAAAAPWAQPEGAPVYELFKRQGTARLTPSPATSYPPALAVPPVSGIPKEWLDKLEAVKDQIANVPISTPVVSADSNAVTYPPGTNLEANGICAYTTGCTTKDDIWAGPDGAFVITFDDGPGAGTTNLSNFLESKQMSAHATHFMIGASIVAEPVLFKGVFDRGGHIASHTWSHSRMTILSNEQIVGELGWTMQAIADNTGGRLPLFWRPPYGDLDNRVRDVAKKVFGLETVVWNRDSNDWKIAREGKAPVEKVFDDWANGPKNPGLNVLMHEINTGTVDIFIAKFQNFVDKGWKVLNVAEAFNKPMYFNAADNKATVTPMTIKDLGANGSPAPAANSSASAGASAGASGAASGSGSATASAAPAATKPSSASRGFVAPVATILVAVVAAAFF